MNLKLITPATDEPVALEEFKAHARIDDNGDDADVGGKVLAARVHVENVTNRALITSTWQAFFRYWPGTRWEDGRVNDPVFRIPLGNLQSVTSVTFTDSTGAQQTVDPSTYEVDLLAGEILLATGAAWPAAAMKRANPICTTFVCGWTVDTVPQTIKAAIELLAAHWYRNREAVTIGRTTVESMPLKMAVDALITPYILWKF